MHLFEINNIVHQPVPSGSSGMYVFSICKEDGFWWIPLSISDLNTFFILCTVSKENRILASLFSTLKNQWKVHCTNAIYNSLINSTVQRNENIEDSPKLFLEKNYHHFSFAHWTYKSLQRKRSYFLTTALLMWKFNEQYYS